MENQENNVMTDQLNSTDSEIKGYLLETTKWGKFLAIVGYVGIGLLVLIAVGIMFAFSAKGSSSTFGFPMGVFGLVYLVIAVLYFFPVNYLHRFSTLMKEGLEAGDRNLVSSGFANLKSLFRFMGIFTIVVLSIYALMLVIVVPLALFLGK